MQICDIYQRFLHQFITKWKAELNVLARCKELLLLEQSLVLIFHFVVFNNFDAGLCYQFVEQLLTINAKDTHKTTLSHLFHHINEFVDIGH